MLQLTQMIVHCYKSVLKLTVVLVDGMSDLFHWSLDSKLYSFTFLQSVLRMHPY